MAKSVYDTYFQSGASVGEYKGALQKVADVWTNIDFSREKSAWETEKRERNLDTLLAATELVSTVGGSMEGFGEGSAAISKQTGMDPESEPLKIGRGGKPWEELSGFQKLFQSPKYQFGEDVIMSKSQVRKFGRDVKEYGKFGAKMPLDAYKTMHEEYRQGYKRSEEDWYLGKHAKGALGVAKKVGQTIAPGGETGYKDLYSGLGKKTSKSQSVSGTLPEDDDPSDAYKPKASGSVTYDLEGITEESLTDFDLPESIDKMAKMMEIYKNKPKGGWNPEGEKWYDSERAGEFGWTGSRWEN